MFSSLHLSRKQREAISLLQIGTFLEYFDLMLYAHMSRVLNELFFPKTDPYTAELLVAFGFCATFVLKPFGALFFGYLGDRMGRKSSVIITTALMAVTCIIMASLPTYDKIGNAAVWGITLCRMLQGVSSIGESVGSEIYLLETTKPPASYPVVGMIGVAGVFGSMMALLFASLVLALGIEWRVAFWIGASIAIIGAAARTRLVETPEFLDAGRRLKQRASESVQQDEQLVRDESSEDVLLSNGGRAYLTTSLAFFVTFCGWPVCFYVSYFYCASLLKSQFGYSSQDVVYHNFALSVINFIGLLFFVIWTYKVHPLRILKWKLYIYVPFIIFTPTLLYLANSPLAILFIQAIGVVFGLSTIPAKAVLIGHFPVLRRFTYAGFLTALSHAVVYAITSFGLVYVTRYYSHYGLWFATIPTALGFIWGVQYFSKLEKGKSEMRRKEYNFLL